MRGHCVAIHADGIIHTYENDYCSEGVPRDFDKDVSDHERFPGIGLCWSLSGFIEIALDDEIRHRLVCHEDLDDQ